MLLVVRINILVLGVELVILLLGVGPILLLVFKIVDTVQIILLGIGWLVMVCIQWLLLLITSRISSSNCVTAKQYTLEVL